MFYKKIIHKPIKNEFILNSVLAIILFFLSLEYSDYPEKAIGIFTLPYETLFFKKSDKIDLQALFDKTERKNIKNSADFNSEEIDAIYVFILDVSKSLNSKIKRPDWLNISLSRINSFTDKKIYQDLDEGRLNIYDAAKIRLSDMLVSTLSSEKLENEFFAIWTLGNEGKKIYPNNNDQNTSKEIKLNMARIKHKYINQSIERVVDLKQESHHTDFEILFKQIEKIYKQHIKYNNKKKHASNIVITILSDLLHDVKNKKEYKGRAKAIKENWNKLIRNIKRMAHANIVVNMVVVTPTGEIEEIPNQQIYYPFEKSFQPHRLTKTKVSGPVQDRLLYPLEFTTIPLTFYYHQKEILNSVELFAIAPIENLIIEIPAQLNENNQDNIELEWQILGASHNGKKSKRNWGVINTNGDVFNNKLLEYQSINLKPIGKTDRFLSSSSVIIRIVNSNVHRVFHVNLKMKKLLPYHIALFTFIVQVSLVVVLIGTVIKFLMLRRPDDPKFINAANELKASERTVRDLQRLWVENHANNQVPYHGEKEVLFHQILGIWNDANETIGFFKDGNFCRVVKPFNTNANFLPGDHTSGNYSILDKDILVMSTKEPYIKEYYVNIKVKRDKLTLQDKSVSSVQIRYNRVPTSD